jgi:hypothetical protein
MGRRRNSGNFARSRVQLAPFDSLHSGAGLCPPPETFKESNTVFRVQHATKILILALLCLLLAALPARAQEAEPTVEVTSAALEVIATAEAPTPEATATEQPTAEVTAAVGPSVTPTEAAAATTGESGTATGLTLLVLLLGVGAVVAVAGIPLVKDNFRGDDDLPA